MALFGCGTLPREPAAPPPITAIEVQDFEADPIRYLPFEDPNAVSNAIAEAYNNETPDNYTTGPDGEHIYNYLAISGGGSDGAFGAGLINGWSESGTRPQFKIVTGVSTGALIAPFAFLGPDYDDELKISYTEVDTKQIFVVRNLLSILWSESVVTTEPLQNLIGRYVNDDLLDKVAAEHRKGRRLYVASTNLDAEQPVVWDMGAIADSGKPDRLTLFRKVLLASASIPSVFPPVMFDVTKDGVKHQELHVDGGVFFQSFFIGAVTDLPAVIKAAHPEFTGKVEQNLYIIRNSWVSPAFQAVARGLPDIAGRAILSMFKVSGINDLWRLYLTTRDDEVSYCFIAIPADYVPQTSEQFNEAEMNREFDFGRKMALKGIPWRTEPPGYEVPPGLAVQ
jgi:hypothetical protein